MFQREIKYDRHSKDFAMYLQLNGGEWELVGFARSYLEAETTLDNLVFEMLNGPYFREVA